MTAPFLSLDPNNRHQIQICPAQTDLPYQVPIRSIQSAQMSDRNLIRVTLRDGREFERRYDLNDPAEQHAHNLIALLLVRIMSRT